MPYVYGSGDSFVTRRDGWPIRGIEADLRATGGNAARTGAGVPGHRMPDAARGEVVELDAAQIREQRFEIVKRGFEPPAVETFLAEIAGEIERRDQELSEVTATIERLEGEIAEARGSEEALRLTLVAATQAKDEMLTAAKAEAEETVASATERAKELLLGSEREAKKTVAAAKERADELMAASQKETDAMALSVLEANAVLLQRLEALSSVVEDTEQMLRSIADDAVPQLEAARGTLLEAITETKETPDVVAEHRKGAEDAEGGDVEDADATDDVAEVDQASDGDEDGDGDLVGKVDRLLEELREVNP
jgi:cell division septum initiation protein DivIVA